MTAPTATTSVLAPATFSIHGPLPTGTTVLEASAGTGKTFTIAALAARYVAEGVATLPELMLVTFGREATTELRERVRDRLRSCERALVEPDPHDEDEVHRLLADAAPDEIARRRARLAHALATFDAATIATTHQFCQQMLDGLGVAGDADPDAVFVESIDDLLTDVVDDFYVRKYGDRGAGPPAFGRAEARELALAAVRDGQARLAPADADPTSTAGTRFRFAAAVRTEVARRQRNRRIYTYDDMLTRLDAALADPARGAAERLRARFRVVLVDEFQDTDPVQWSILRRAFHGHVTLVLIGDPKQAIYAFRGADVVAYLDATRTAGRHATLARNHRSDAPLLRALAVVFNGAALGDDRIVVHPVEAAHEGSRLSGAPVDTAFRLRVARRTDLPPAPRRNLAIVGPARAFVAADLAEDVAALLAGGATLDGVPVRPGDVAVLVRTNDQGGLIHGALTRAGVPAVLTGTASVFGTPVAREWLALLEACEQPRLARLRAVALTCFLGRDVAELAGPGADALLDDLGARVRSFAAVLHERGVAALLEAVTTDTDLPARLLGVVDGERLLTDLRHVGQALHAAAVEAHLGPGALIDWLRHRIDEAASDAVVERSRRLESDSAAVQIITIHRSKGLEFPIVYVPFGWDRNVRDPRVPRYHEGPERVLDVGGETGEGWAQRCAAHRAEEAGEDLRLLYVALTRAASQVVTWWVPATTAAASPVHRLLIGRPGPGTEPPADCRVPTDADALAALRALGCPDLAVEEIGPRPAAGFHPDGAGPGPLTAAMFTRVLDRAWRRTSYTALTAGAGHGAPPMAGASPGLSSGGSGGAGGVGAGGVASEPESPGTLDEPDLTPPAGLGDGVEDAGPAAAEVADVPSPMADLPAGTGFGTLVHAVFEMADLTVPDLRAELTARCSEQLARHPTPGLDAAGLAAGLLPAARTPLGPVAGGLTLADIAPHDRLAELTFELPLAGGDRPRGPSPVLADLAPLLRHHLPAADPLADYADRLAGPALADQPLRGYLTGSIDAVLRLRDARHIVVDYKTNWLGPVSPDGAEPLRAAHYTPARLAAAMMEANYPLQALLYGVALHRFLRWRLPGYDPDRHLGGALYLFVRGLCGPATPTVDGVACGVFGWSPPPALTVALSELLDGRGPA